VEDKPRLKWKEQKYHSHTSCVAHTYLFELCISDGGSWGVSDSDIGGDGGFIPDFEGLSLEDRQRYCELQLARMCREVLEELE
jgi:hypothetical protein